jgi:hypothetical protein
MADQMKNEVTKILGYA